MMTQLPNVILLSIDALRADHLGYHGYERDTSPFLDSLAERSAAFTTTISASSHTREALPALLSGHHPDVFAATGYRCATETLADRLSTASYRTAGFHSNPYVSRAYGFDSGFDTFDDDLLLGKNRLVALAQRALNKFLLSKGEYHVRAEELNQRSLSWLDSLDGDEAFFLWNHYMDPHGPYNPPPGYTYGNRDLSNDEAHSLYQKCIKQPNKVTDEERQVLIDSYDGEIRYLDDQLAALFDTLASRGLLEQSLVVVTADHGDAFREHGYFTHPRHLHDSLLHVPLLISSADITVSARVTTPVSTLDLVPTILDSVGVAHEELPGMPLFDATGVATLPDERVVFASATGEGGDDTIRRFAARTKTNKVVIERETTDGLIIDEWAYDLQADPSETTSVNPDKAQFCELLGQLRAYSSDRMDTASEEDEFSLNEVEERLAALGYK